MGPKTSCRRWSDPSPSTRRCLRAQPDATCAWPLAIALAPAGHNCVVPVRWSVVAADDWAVAGLESQGQHPHDWLKHPSRERTWLFKPARPERDRSLGEDIVEKLGSEMARLVGVPAATVELATRGGVRGALVEDVRLPEWELQAGQALMPEVVIDYDPTDPEARIQRRLYQAGTYTVWITARLIDAYVVSGFRCVRRIFPV
jgi:hypothetical protein